MSTVRRWGDGFDWMTLEDIFGRGLRVDLGCTWRMVAESCSEKWGGDWDCDQAAGREICERAAALLGEDGRSVPWN